LQGSNLKASMSQMGQSQTLSASGRDVCFTPADNYDMSAKCQYRTLTTCPVLLLLRLSFRETNDLFTWAQDAPDHHVQLFERRLFFGVVGVTVIDTTHTGDHMI
jgi:hypothetical protein